MELWNLDHEDKSILFEALLSIIPSPSLVVAMEAMASILKDIWSFTYLHTWDLGLVLVNLFTPKLKKGKIYKPGEPGYNGLWPEFIPPNPETDSRGPCPGLSE